MRNGTPVEGHGVGRHLDIVSRKFRARDPTTPSDRRLDHLDIVSRKFRARDPTTPLYPGTGVTFRFDGVGVVAPRASLIQGQFGRCLSGRANVVVLEPGYWSPFRL
jgi:hypothetical protein